MATREQVLAMFIEGWENAYGERLTPDEANYHLGRVMSLLRLIRSTNAPDKRDVGDVKPPTDAAQRHRRSDRTGDVAH